MTVGNNKLKLLYLMRILLDKTDEEHAITMSEILKYLSSYGITAERKSLYTDIETLRQYGLDITGYKENKNFYYQVSSREFELAELKLLVDSVQASKFITAKKSNTLIKKIEKLASEHESSQLSRQVYVTGRVKTLNENILYNVDAIHDAISENKRISFQYFNWNEKKEQVLRHDGAVYEVSPWALSWDDENYYLIAFDSDSATIRHFRVDKMVSLTLIDGLREGLQEFKSFDMASYTKKTFGMWSGEEETVTLICDNSMAGVIIDRFGINVPIRPQKKGTFEVSVNVAVSRHFLSWVISLGNGVKIKSPKHVVDYMKKEISRLASQYNV